MQNITTIEELKNAIQLLEVEQSVKWQLLKEQLSLTYKSLKPVNLLMGTLKDIATSPDLIDTVLGTAMGLATGYLSKKLVVRSSGSIVRKLIGSALQVGVANAVSRHPDALISFGRFILHRIHRKKELNPKQP